MAVYVDLTLDDVASFIAPYDIGECVGFEGIAQGVSNTNYHVFTDRNTRFILTLFEPRRTNADDLPFVFDWASHLNKCGIPCPEVLSDKNDCSFHALKGRAAVLVHYLTGKDIPRGKTTPAQCQNMGGFTARMHKASMDFNPIRSDDWSLARLTATAARYSDDIHGYDAALMPLIKHELSFQAKIPLESLPTSVVHTDLFPDNVFFNDDGDIAGVIDLYFACTRAFVYDLAVVVNAWCFNGQGGFHLDKFNALMDGYNMVRPLTAPERAAFQTALRLASLRFLMSRLEELVTHDPSCTAMTPHDPREYSDRLAFHKAHDIMAAYK